MSFELWADDKNTAWLSPCRRYRYVLTRRWGTGPPATFVMLNPSIADGLIDDQTIRRCIGFAKLWGLGALVVVNLAIPGMDQLQSLGVTKSGAPRHPSRLPYAARLEPWEPAS